VSSNITDRFDILHTDGGHHSSDDPPPLSLKGFSEFLRSTEQPLDHSVPVPDKVSLGPVIEQASNSITISDAVFNSVVSGGHGAQKSLILRTPAARRTFFTVGRIFEKRFLDGEDFNDGTTMKEAQSSLTLSVKSVVVREGKYSSICVPLVNWNCRRSLSKKEVTQFDADACAAVHLYGEFPISDGPVPGKSSLAVQLEDPFTLTPPISTYMDFRSLFEHPHLPHVIPVGFVDPGSLEHLQAFGTEHVDILRQLPLPQIGQIPQQLLNIVKKHSARVEHQKKTKYKIELGSSYYVYVRSLDIRISTAWLAVKNKLEIRYESFPVSDQGSMFVLLLDPELSECQTPEFASLFEASTVNAAVVMSVTWSGKLRHYELMPEVCDFFHNGSLTIST
jgi:hypothetical protein